MEVIVSLDLEAVKLEAGCHPAHPIIGLEQHSLMSVQSKLIGYSQTHRTRAKYCNSLSHLEIQDYSTRAANAECFRSLGNAP